jgi:acid stress-induced BolA-like protein IbaG/YrbA
MTLDDLKSFLHSFFPSSEQILCTGSLYHVEIIIIDPVFEDLSTLKRHQKIYKALSPLIQDQTLHALTLKTWTPKEYSDNLSPS